MTVNTKLCDFVFISFGLASVVEASTVYVGEFFITENTVVFNATVNAVVLANYTLTNRFNQKLPTFTRCAVVFPNLTS